MKLSLLYQDTNAESDGVWCTYPIAAEKPPRVKIARDTLPEFQDAVRRALDPHVERWRAGQISDDEMRELVREPVSRYLIRDWADIEDDDGKPVAFSPEAAIAMLGRPELSEFYVWIRACAGKASLYRQRAQAAAKGN